MQRTLQLYSVLYNNRTYTTTIYHTLQLYSVHYNYIVYTTTIEPTLQLYSMHYNYTVLIIYVSYFPQVLVTYVSYLLSHFPPYPSLNRFRTLLTKLLDTTARFISVRYLQSHFPPWP
jgi:hypothetical protein